MVPKLSDERDTKLQKVIQEISKFHGKAAPGVYIGAYMVDLAQELLGSNFTKLNAISETNVCLSDAVQVMTGCTIGNKYLWLHDFGLYAMTLYDRETKDGFRVFVDYAKITNDTPTLKKFFDGSRKFDKIPRPVQQKMVVEEFLTVKRDILSFQKVKVNQPTKPKLRPLSKCDQCNDFFRTQIDQDDQNICPFCINGSNIYTFINE
ncbi:MAG: formylmethanofuran dehydrogenase [Candidatus Cloacimonetes bacterium]|nr:formylmethanofuran dehydrogenase [Candidatus Cloacimonadota bacterium]